MTNGVSKVCRKFRLRGFPAWMPEEVRAGVLACRDAMRAQKGSDKRGLLWKAEFSRGERRVLTYAPPMPVSRWAERYRVVETGAIRGKWKNLFTPYLVGIMDVMGMPFVQRGSLCKSPQTGGSESGHNIVGYCVDRMPGDVMYVFPDELTARENARDRIIPMITGTPRLASYMTGSDDDASALRIKLAHMVIYLGWSGSVSRLGNKPIRILIMDEVDKYKDPKNEATSIDLAEKRTTTWEKRGRKIFKISTPTTENGNIWRAFNEADVRFVYWVKCPHCGEMQLMKLENIGWPNKGTPDEPKFGDVYSKRSAWYACEHCGVCWNDADRDRAVRAGRWREQDTGMDMYAYMEAYKPVSVAWHLPAWLSYFVSLSEIASKILRWTQSGELSALKDLKNNYEAQPWAEQHEERKEDSILLLCDDRPRGVVPGPLPDSPDVPRVACLLAGVDTQKDYFRYVIRAFGYGRRGPTWQVQCGALNTFDDIDEVMRNRVYTDVSGTEYRVSGIMIDAMGDRTAKVYEYCADRKGWAFPWKGEQRMSTPYDLTPLEYYPEQSGKKKRIEGGLTLFRCNTTHYKSDLAQRLLVAPGDPGAYLMHSNERGELKQYAAEMVAETWDDEHQCWVNAKRRPNHYWDCEVMALALADIKGVQNIPLPGREVKRAVRRVVHTAPRKYGRY